MKFSINNLIRCLTFLGLTLLVTKVICAEHVTQEIKTNHPSLEPLELQTTKGTNESKILKETKTDLLSIPFKNGEGLHPVTLIDPIVFDEKNKDEIIDFFWEYGYVVIDHISLKSDRDELVTLIDKLANSNITALKNHVFMDLYHDKSLANLRQNPKLYNIFTSIYNTPNLWVVFDRVIYWDKNEKTRPLPPHVDQNPNIDPGFKYVQGMLALRDMDEHTGTLALVPESDTFFNLYKDQTTEVAQDCCIEYNDSIALPFIALRLKEGQMVIWDSRITHSRFRGNPLRNRYAALISYTQASDDVELIKLRQKCYIDGVGCHNRRAGLRASKKLKYHNSLRETPEELTDLGKKLYGVVTGDEKFVSD